MYKKNTQGWLKHIDFILWDLIALQVSFILAYKIRHGMKLTPYTVDTYRSLALVFIAIDLLVIVLFNTMHNVVKRGLLLEFAQSLRHVILVLLFMALYLFSMQTGDTFSRITVYLTAGFHFVFGYVIRVVWKFVIRHLYVIRTKGKMILVADETQVADIIKRSSALDGFRYSGLVLSNRNATGEEVEGIPVVAGVSDAADYICRERVDEVFFYSAQMSDCNNSANLDMEAISPDDIQGRVNVLVEQCRQMAIPVHLRLPLASVGGKTFIEKVGGYDVLTTTANYAAPWKLVLKRLMDIAGGLVGSLIALVIMLIYGRKIKKESPGPILFKQTRIGLNGKKFTMYKLRSMYMDAEERKQELMDQNRVADGMMFKMDFDPRIIGNKIVDGKQVTGIGEKLRRSSLDEFPQFFNILKGDMSLVGTRPPTEDEWEKYKYHHRARLATKPGLTGMWQVNGRSDVTDFEEVVNLDTAYINNWSMRLDLKILVKTFKAVFMRKGAM
ncbi:MAG: sugar transferase [Lachnospiraceae bacterium]|nr:sugar transferase [Lachnospiraceae bacterium]